MDILDDQKSPQTVRLEKGWPYKTIGFDFTMDKESPGKNILPGAIFLNYIFFRKVIQVFCFSYPRLS